jgi:hypothetical protein
MTTIIIQVQEACNNNNTNAKSEGTTAAALKGFPNTCRSIPKIALRLLDPPNQMGALD